MALTYLDSAMIELPAHINSLSTTILTSDNINVTNLTAAELFTDDINFPQTGGYIYNNTNIFGDLTITGSITALSGLTVIPTTVTSTTALSVVNTGTGTTLFVSQTTPNTSSVADFRSNNTSVLKVNNTLPDNGQPGVDIFSPGTGPSLRVTGRTALTNLSAPVGVISNLTSNNHTSNSITTNTITANTFNVNNFNVDFYSVTDLSATTFTLSTISFQGKSSITAPTDSVAGWSWDSTLAGQGDVTEIHLRPNGTKLYVCRASNILQYTLTAAWELSSAVLDTTFTIPWDTGTNGICFSPDGTRFATVGTTAVVGILPGVVAAQDRAWYATLSSAWDLTSTTLVSTLHLAAGVAGQYAAETSPTGIAFDNTGNIMYIVGSTLDVVQQFTLTQPYNVSTATFSKVLSVGDQDTAPTSIHFNETGTSLYILGSTGDDVMEYRLSTPWDVATATFFQKLYIGDRELTPTGLHVAGSGANFAYIAGSSSDAVQRYRTDTQVVSIKPELTFSNIDLYGNVNFKRLDPSVVGSVMIDKNLRVMGATTVEGSFAGGGTISSSGNITCGGDITVTGNDVLIGSATAAAALFSGITTGTLSVATSQTTGGIDIGGTAATGNINIGRSTSATGQNIVLGQSGNRIVYGITPALSAGGGSQAGAAAINSTITNVTIASGGVRLPTAVAGMRLLVRNSALSSINIYPATGAIIDTLPVNLPYLLLSSAAIEMFATTTTQWYTF